MGFIGTIRWQTGLLDNQCHLIVNSVTLPFLLFSNIVPQEQLEEWSVRSIRGECAIPKWYGPLSTFVNIFGDRKQWMVLTFSWLITFSSVKPLVAWVYNKFLFEQDWIHEVVIENILTHSRCPLCVGEITVFRRLRHLVLWVNDNNKTSSYQRPFVPRIFMSSTIFVCTVPVVFLTGLLAW